MRPIGTGGVAWSVSLSVMTLSPAKMAEMIEMLPFGIWTPVGPRNYVLDGVQILPCEGVIFRGKMSARL